MSTEPIRLESEGQNLEVSFGLDNGISKGCLNGRLQLKILTPFLRDFFNK